MKRIPVQETCGALLQSGFYRVFVFDGLYKILLTSVFLPPAAGGGSRRSSPTTRGKSRPAGEPWKKGGGGGGGAEATR